MTDQPKPAAADLDLSGVTWRASSSGGGEDAIEVARHDDLILVRKSGDPDGTILVFTPAEWRAFVLGAKDGEFDLP
jgi:hypothetical protein